MFNAEIAEDAEAFGAFHRLREPRGLRVKRFFGSPESTSATSEGDGGETP